MLDTCCRLGSGLESFGEETARRLAVFHGSEAAECWVLNNPNKNGYDVIKDFGNQACQIERILERCG